MGSFLVLHHKAPPQTRQNRSDGEGRGQSGGTAAWENVFVVGGCWWLDGVNTHDVIIDLPTDMLQETERTLINYKDSSPCIFCGASGQWNGHLKTVTFL